MDRNHIDKIAQSDQDRLLLAKLWDKIQSGILKNIPANTPFLTPREQALAQYLFGNAQGLYFYGGYEDAERKMLVYLPDYLQEDWLQSEDSCLCCLRATFYENDCLTHRDFLGALMGAGIARQAIGDICVHTGSCDFLTTRDLAPYILQHVTEAGRTKLHIVQIPLDQLQVPQMQTQQIRDTVASVRLDSILATGFRMGRAQASQYIGAGKVAIDGAICDKPDKLLTVGAKISVRGAGKIQLTEIGKQTKKGRIGVVIDRYI